MELLTQMGFLSNAFWDRFSKSLRIHVKLTNFMMSCISYTRYQNLLILFFSQSKFVSNFSLQIIVHILS